MALTTAELVKRTAIIVAVALVPLLVWYLIDVILMAMGAVLVAILLNLVADLLVRFLRFPQGPALFSSCIIIACGAALAGFYLVGAHVNQLQDILLRIHEAFNTLRQSLEGSEIGRLILGHLDGYNSTVAGVATGFLSASVGFLSATVISVVGGIYLAAQADVYREGLIGLLPHNLRANGRETLADMAGALRLWMLGQLISMALVGLMTALATSLIGLPSAFALGVIAGLFEFLPYLGPFLGAVPAVLVAMTQGLDTMLWTIGAYTLIQQIEGHLISPLISREMVYIPPLVSILGILAITAVFGRYAAIFAAPITVIIFVAVKKLYIRDSLGDATLIPGEPAAAADEADHAASLTPGPAGEPIDLAPRL